jgi:hypothetical protein
MDESCLLTNTHQRPETVTEFKIVNMRVVLQKRFT